MTFSFNSLFKFLLSLLKKYIYIYIYVTTEEGKTFCLCTVGCAEALLNKQLNIVCIFSVCVSLPRREVEREKRERDEEGAREMKDVVCTEERERRASGWRRRRKKMKMKIEELGLSVGRSVEEEPEQQFLQSSSGILGRKYGAVDMERVSKMETDRR